MLNGIGRVAMREKPMWGFKLKRFSVVMMAALALAIGSLWFAASRSVVPTVAPIALEELAINPPPASPAAPSALAQATATNQKGNAKGATTWQGTLRVGNVSDHPVRLALLLQTTNPKGFENPAHWDFDPGEGSTQGLVLSLPQRTLKLKQGDVLVAFAQDGSRRYWGPFVVGETPVPSWSTKAKEWQLLLEP